MADGKPTVLVEIGENGRTDDAFVAPVVSGVVNLLNVLKMTNGTPLPVRADTRWFDDTAGVNATHTGIFTPVATTAREVRRGEALGTINQRTPSPINLPITLGLQPTGSALQVILDKRGV